MVSKTLSTWHRSVTINTHHKLRSRVNKPQMVRRALLSLAVALAALTGTQAAYCHGAPDPDAPANTQPLLPGDATLLKSTDLAKLYSVNYGQNTSFHLLHLYGQNSYENGKAYGEILKDELNVFVAKVWKYLEEEAMDSMPGFFPKWFQVSRGSCVVCCTWMCVWCKH